MCVSISTKTIKRIEMKKIAWVVAILLLTFLILVYISVSGNKEFETALIVNIDDVENINFREHDSIKVAATTLYKGNFLKKAMQGKNYRTAWTTPVGVPVVFLDTLKGGLKIVKEGGGTQTHSLRLQSPDGVLYSLRSINKDPRSHVPEFAQILGLENIVIDGISAQHPYGAVAAASLSELAGVLHTNPKPMFIPKQELLGTYNEKYGNRLFLLEYETQSKVNWTHYNNVVNIIETNDLQELKMTIGSRLQIEKSAVVRARLFDLLIGDWDRHSKQWGWVIQESGQDYKAIPLPGDRDNAFFNIDGVIPTIISNKNVEPLVRPFEKEIDYMPGLVYPFDVYFLRGTPEEIYIQEARSLQQALTEENIRKALKKAWPKALYDLDGEEIITKMMHRKNDLVEYAKEFRKVIEARAILTAPLKGSEDIKFSPRQLECFECL